MSPASYRAAPPRVGESQHYVSGADQRKSAYGRPPASGARRSGQFLVQRLAQPGRPLGRPPPGPAPPPGRTRLPLGELAAGGRRAAPAAARPGRARPPRPGSTTAPPRGSLPSRASSRPRLKAPLRLPASAASGTSARPPHVAAGRGEHADPHLGAAVPLPRRPARTTPRTRSSPARLAEHRRSGRRPPASRAARRAGRRPRRCRRPPRSADGARRLLLAVPQQGDADLERRLGVPGRRGPLVPAAAPHGPRPRPACRMPRLKAASTLPASAALENHGSAPAASPRLEQQHGQRVGGLAVAGVGGAAVPLLGLGGTVLAGAEQRRGCRRR